MLLLVLGEIFSDRAQDSTADSSEETMTCLLAQEVASEATADGTQKTSIGFVHGRSVGVVVWSIGVAGLRRELVLTDVWLLAALASHLLLVCLVLSVGLVAAVALALALALALRLSVVAGMALRIGGVVGTVLAAGLTVLETTLLRGAEGVLATRGTKVLVLLGILRVALLRI